MQDITIGRYDDNRTWGGWIEPKDRSWIIFVNHDGRPLVYFGARDERGGVIEGSQIDL